MNTLRQITSENGIVITIKAYDINNKTNPQIPIP